MTVVAIHQPGYFPWLGLIEKIACCDLFIALDTVQYNRDAFQHRTLYSTAAGEKYLSLSVAKAGYLDSGLKIRDVALADPRMPRKHFTTLRQRYGKSPGWARWQGEIEALLLDAPADLLTLSLRTMALTMAALGVDTPVVLASTLGCGGDKGELVLNLVKAAGGDVYLSGVGAKAYQDDATFDRAGVALVYQDFVHPVYPQSHGGAFVPGCFALEWALEAGDQARAAFAGQVAAARGRMGLEGSDR